MDISRLTMLSQLTKMIRMSRIDLSKHQRRALRKISRRVFCARWLVQTVTRKSLLKRGLCRNCGFYSLEITDAGKSALGI